MATEREPDVVWTGCAWWMEDRKLVSARRKYFEYKSYDEVPQWLRERMAVLRLVEQHMASPIGFWYTRHDGHTTLYRIAATEEEQEEWLRWRKG